MQELAARLTALLKAAIDAGFSPGPYRWEHIYEMGDGDVHWALCDPQSTQEGRISSHLLVLLASWPPWSGDAPETWGQPLSTEPVLRLVAETLTLLPEIIAQLDQYASLLSAARHAVNNWHEFEGPAYGFDEWIDHLNTRIKAVEAASIGREVSA